MVVIAIITLSRAIHAFMHQRQRPRDRRDRPDRHARRRRPPANEHRRCEFDGSQVTLSHPLPAGFAYVDAVLADAETLKLSQLRLLRICPPMGLHHLPR